MRKRLTGILFLSILLLAIGLRLMGLDRSFVSDEYRTIKFAGSRMAEIPGILKDDAYPPLSYFFLSAWLDISGNDVWTRLLFVIFGVFSVVLVYSIGRELMDAKYAILAMFLMALMPMQVWVSQYIRGIGPSIFFLLLSTLFFLRLLKDNAGMGFRLNAAGYILSSIAAIYSFYFAFFIIGAQNIIYVITKRDKPANIFKWLAFQVLLAVSFLPWLDIFLWQMRNSNVFMNFSVMQKSGLTLWGLKIGTLIRCFSGFLGLDQSFLMNTAVAKDISVLATHLIPSVFFIAIIFLLSFFVFMYKRFRQNPIAGNAEFSYSKIFIFFLLFAVTPLAASVFLNVFFKSSILARYFAVSSAFLVFVYALIFYSIRNKKIYYFILAAFILISFVRIYDFTKTLIDYKNSAIFVKNNIRDGECLLFVSGDMAYEHYCEFPEDTIKTADYMRPYDPDTGSSYDRFVDEEELVRRLRPYKTVWIYNRAERMAGEVRYICNIMERHGYKKGSSRAFKNIEIFKYVKKS